MAASWEITWLFASATIRSGKSGSLRVLAQSLSRSVRVVVFFSGTPNRSPGADRRYSPIGRYECGSEFEKLAEAHHHSRIWSR
jgi:hypothetical protein